MTISGADTGAGRTETPATEVAKPSFGKTLRSPALLLAAGFASGLSPVAPGTAGSLVTIPLAWWLIGLGTPQLLAATSIIFLLGVWSSAIAGKAWGKVDHGAIVIDEVAGQLLTFAVPLVMVPGFAPDSAFLLAGFALFRLFDIVKPWPARYFDLHCKNAWGVMLDDIAAGLMAGIVLMPLVLLN